MIKRHLYALVILAVLTILVYSNSFSNSFVWDDHAFIVENLSIRQFNMKGLVSFFTNRESTASSEELSRDVWRPLSTASFAVDFKLWGLNPGPYHVENALLHTMNAVLVYIATFLILQDPIASFFAGCIFAIHPVQTAAVTWASGRSNLLSCLFFLSALIFHIRNRKEERAFNYNCSLILFSLSLLAKEMAVTLPLVFILYDLHFAAKKRFKYYAAFYLPFFLISLSYVAARYSVLGRFAQQEVWWGGNILDNLLTMLKALAGYVRLLFLPFNLRAEYMVDISRSVLDPYTASAIMVLTAVGLLFMAMRRIKAVSFYILWFFITLIPVSNIVPFKAIMAERFLYLPLVGFASLIGISFARLWQISARRQWQRIVATAVLIFVFMAYGVLTIARNTEWRDEVTFCTKEVARSPSNPRFHYNLGLAYLKEAYASADSKNIYSAYCALAMKEFEEAARLNPGFLWAHVNLGNLHAKAGLYDLAIEDYKKAIAIRESGPAYNNLAIAYYNKGLLDEALAACRKALSLSPLSREAYVTLDNIYSAKGEDEKARLARHYAAKLDEASDVRSE